MVIILDTEYVRWEIVDGILVTYFKPGLKLTEELSRKLIAMRLEFTKGKSYPNLNINQGVVQADKKARDILSSSEGVRGIKAGAFVVESAFSRVLISFYLRVTSPKVPTKLFSTKEEAIAWLQKFK